MLGIAKNGGVNIDVCFIGVHFSLQMQHRLSLFYVQVFADGLIGSNGGELLFAAGDSAGITGSMIVPFSYT